MATAPTTKVTKTPKMFRGIDRYHWERNFVVAGWPQPLAGLMAAWATGEGPLPHWPDALVGLNARGIVE